MTVPGLQQFRESLLRRKQNLADWLRGATADERSTRAGPAKPASIEEHLRSIDTAITRAENQTLGLCEVCHEPVETSRLEMDYTACVCIEHLSGAERSRLESDLELSQKVQRALLPHDVPSIPSLEIAAFSQPAHIVGGDYFDFLTAPGGTPAFVIADVMGKGMSASLLMASLQASLRIIAPATSGPAAVVARLNDIFCNNIRLTKFVTLFFAHYDEAGGRLTYCSAGHNPPLLRRRSGRVEQLLPTGAAIGLVEQTAFAEEQVALEPGDTLLLYTDGVVESWNPQRELFGQERLEAHLNEASELAPAQLIQSIRLRLQSFAAAAPPADDTTIVVLQRRQPPLTNRAT